MKYGKTIAAVVYAGLLSFHAIAASGPMTAGLAVLQVAGTAVAGGLDSTEIVLAILAALGVYLAPASTETPSGDDLTVGWGSDALL
jgi:hypothetical protein